MAENHNRKRGDALTDAVYAACYQLMEADEPSQLTISHIAELAHTSRSVIYRYWDSLFDLLFEAIWHQLQITPTSLASATFNEGTLRKDLMYVMDHFMRETEQGATKYFHQLFNQTVDEADRERVQQMLAAATQANLVIMKHVVENAKARDEISQAPADEALLVPFQLIRYQTMIAGVPITKAMIRGLVDSIMVPIFDQQK